MKAAICEVCLKNDMLCEGCSKKLEEGEISERAVEISKYLYSLTDDYPYLEDVEISEIYIGEDVIIIVASEDDVGRVVGKGGEVVKELASEFKRAIRVVESSEDVKKFARNLLPDVKVYGVNKVFSPEEDYYRIVVDSEDKNRIMLKEEELSEVMERITGEKARISFRS
ncbi:MAG: KH domain-containing protein [Candidatus Aenigmatarchaeota archaeon]